ncbi:DUF6691 family protein [Geoalkalibacter subterraneus]|uniref:YeeE/YedE family protein n=1 Tax=Geoalkalibacter subterraneus TaxID=483547 RepID=A0A0B5FTH2_9BACT|nr:DUF6691 family protein [Geoalkalibacter subterraneus]AJF07470.1 YeeE/YedE family protein [Geoalkalibacter subterraneus]
MLEKIHRNRAVQLFLGFVMGLLFGFFLQKGQVTKYEIIMNQLFLEDFTVVKVILTAVVTGMVGIFFLKRKGLARLHPKAGSIGSTVIGSLIFGVGFALLGYCPGTAAGAVGQGSLDALFGGVFGILAGCALYAVIYPWLERHILNLGSFGEITLPELFKADPLKVNAIVAGAILVVLVALEFSGY